MDSGILNSTVNKSKIAEEPLADLKTQVQQWIRFENKQRMSSRTRETEKKGTIFTVWFSLWDLWYYSNKTQAEASEAIEETVNTLFEQLDLVAEHWGSRMKIVMPEAIDPTFLPGWLAKRTGPAGNDKNADDQRNAVLLVQQWNSALDNKARFWDKGDLYIYNTNGWLMDQVREQQLEVGGVADATGLGQSGSPWVNVNVGCVGSNEKGHKVSSQTSEGVVRCEDPTKYLFW